MPSLSLRPITTKFATADTEHKIGKETQVPDPVSDLGSPRTVPYLQHLQEVRVQFSAVTKNIVSFFVKFST